MGVVPPRCPEKIRTPWVRILRSVLASFMVFAYSTTAVLGVGMTREAIEAAPTTKIRLWENAKGEEILEADGDITLRTFSSSDNLIIRTPGIVTFSAAGYVGGFLGVDAKDIVISKDVCLRGRKAYLGAGQDVRFEGSFESEEETTIKAGQRIGVFSRLFSTQGTLDFFGKELENFGDIDASHGIQGNVGHVKNHNLFRTKGNLSLETTFFENLCDSSTRKKGRVFAFGLLKINSVARYDDAGEVYSPLLSTISAESIRFLSTHRFYGNNVDIRAGTITAEGGSNFEFQNTLQFSSDNGDVYHHGYVKQIESGLFPYYKDYFPTRCLPPNILIPDLDVLTGELHLREYAAILRAIDQMHGSRIALSYRVKRDLTREGEDICLSGSPHYYVDGKFDSRNHRVKTGVFATNNVLIRAAAMALKNTSIRSYGSACLLSEGKTHIDQAIVKANQTAQVNVKEQMDISRTFAVEGREGASLQSKEVTGDHLAISSERSTASVQAETLALEKLSTGRAAAIDAHDAKLAALKSEGDTCFRIEGDLSLGQADLKGRLEATAKSARIGRTQAQSVAVQANIYTIAGSINTEQDAVFYGKHGHMEEDSSVHAGGKATVRGTESFTGHPTAAIRGEGGTVLYAPQSNGFVGTISSGSEAELWLKEMGLHQILAQVRASEIKAHLDSDIHVTQDLQVTQNLYVFANSFENKAVILAPAKFVIHMVGDITNAGFIKGSQDLILFTTKGNVQNTGQAVTSGRLGIQGQSVVNRGGTFEGGQADITATAGSILSDRGTLSGRDSLRAIATGSIKLNQTEVSSAKSDILFDAGDQCHFYAPHVDAFGNITVLGKRGVIIDDIHDLKREETHTKEDSQERNSVHISRTSRGGFFASQNGSVTLKSEEGDISLTNIHVKASEMVLEALKGVVAILQGENESHSQEYEKSEDIFFKKHKKRSEDKVTHSASSFSGSLTVRAKETIVEVVKGEALEFLDDIIKNGGIVSHKIIQNLSDIKEEKHVVPTAALSIVIGLAASICTAGVGGAIVGAAAAASSALAAAAAAAISGAASALVTQASLALLCCEGDIGKAAQRLASEDSLKTIVTSTLTAGVTGGLTNALGLPATPQDLGDHLAKQGLKNGVGAGMQMAQGGKAGDVLSGAALNTALGTVAGVGAQAIGDAYAKGDMSGLGHTAAHGVWGGAVGAATAEIMGGDGAKGFAAGAAGAMIAENVAEAFDSADSSDTARLRAAAFGNFVSGAAALATSQGDGVVSYATAAATNATDNNFLAHTHQQSQRIAEKGDPEPVAVCVSADDFSLSAGQGATTRCTLVPQGQLQDLLSNNRDLGTFSLPKTEGFFPGFFAGPGSLERGFGDDSQRVKLYSLNVANTYERDLWSGFRLRAQDFTSGCIHGVTTSLAMGGPLSLPLLPEVCMIEGGRGLLYNEASHWAGSASYEISLSLGASESQAQTTQLFVEEEFPYLLDTLRRPSILHARAPEYHGGHLTETQFINSTNTWLGPEYLSLPNGRYVSRDGLRQVRYGSHEGGTPHHVHFEAYDRSGGKIIENTQVHIRSDK